METVRILKKTAALSWDYDEGADVLYLTIGEPRPAVGVDIGEGLLLRYDEEQREVVGLTLLGLRARLLRNLASSPEQVYTLHESSDEYNADSQKPDGEAPQA